MPSVLEVGHFTTSFVKICLREFLKDDIDGAVRPWPWRSCPRYHHARSLAGQPTQSRQIGSGISLRQLVLARTSSRRRPRSFPARLLAVDQCHGSSGTASPSVSQSWAIVGGLVDGSALQRQHNRPRDRLRTLYRVLLATLQDVQWD